MVHNYVGECRVCKTSIRLRIQVSEGSIPVCFECPTCHTPIEGKIDVIDPSLALEKTIPEWFTYSIPNLVISKKPPQYVLEVSKDFFVQKIKPDNDEAEPSPFLKAFSEFGSEGIHTLNVVVDTANRLISILPTMIMIHKLWDNKRYPDLYRQISQGNEYTGIIGLESLKTQIIAPINALVVLHQARELWLRNLYNENTFVEIRSVKGTIFHVPEAVRKFAPFSKIVFQSDYFKDFNVKALESTKRLIRLLPSLYPSIPRIDISSDDNEYITSYSPDVADEMMSLYELMFECVCDKSDILIGYNNIFHRGNVDKFIDPKKTGGFSDTISEYTKKYRKVKELLAPGEKYSHNIPDTLSDTIRNSIAHKDAVFSPNENAFSFPDIIHPLSSQKLSGAKFSFLLLKLFYKLNVLYEYSFWTEFLYRNTFGRETITYGS